MSIENVVEKKRIKYVKTLVVNLSEDDYICRRNEQNYLDLKSKIDKVLNRKRPLQYDQVMLNIWDLCFKMAESQESKYTAQDIGEGLELIAELLGDRKLILTNDKGDFERSKSRHDQHHNPFNFMNMMVRRHNGDLHKTIGKIVAKIL